ncbi:DUF6225 family protein [Kineosporia sp. A_224]|uniref:DUF6225 family protein n=1 Tax=Kineosporia sp. A_224 TaxID=1962180 RepID=UPI000B4B44B7|nr:DUF6225 family protein [Kineosporia sp. A_224]
MAEAGDDRIVVQHVGHVVTVADLRAALTGLPDDAQVHVAVPERPGEETSALYPVAGLHEPAVRPTRGAGLVVALRADFPSGAYLLPRRGWLTVRHGLPEGPDGVRLHDGLATAVEGAVAALGYRGPASTSRDGGTTEWAWQSAGAAVSDVLDAAVAAVGAFAATVPGDERWDVEVRVER